jgi:hypothetical protein
LFHLIIIFHFFIVLKDTTVVGTPETHEAGAKFR